MTAALFAKSSTQSALQHNGADAVVYEATGLVDGADLGIRPISAAVAANALTITLNPCTLQFRSATLGSGAVTHLRVGSAITLAISSGSTLGTVNAIQSRIVVLALNNAGTVELAAVNIAGGTALDETGVISTTAEGGAGAADSATVIYSTAARTSVAYRVIGYVESTQATAGTWATAPSTIQGQGGQALAAMSSLGYGQTWQNLAGSRAYSTTYYNTTGKPIWVDTQWIAGAGATLTLAVITIGGVARTAQRDVGDSNAGGRAIFIVPPGMDYRIVTNPDAGTSTIRYWAELR